MLSGYIRFCDVAGAAVYPGAAVHPSRPLQPTWTPSDSFRQARTKLANFPFLIMRRVLPLMIDYSATFRLHPLSLCGGCCRFRQIAVRLPVYIRFHCVAGAAICPGAVSYTHLVCSVAYNSAMWGFFSLALCVLPLAPMRDFSLALCAPPLAPIPVSYTHLARKLHASLSFEKEVSKKTS